MLRRGRSRTSGRRQVWAPIFTALGDETRLLLVRRLCGGQPFRIAEETAQMISLHGEHINLFIDRGPAIGPVLEVTVESVEEVKIRLVKNGCAIVKDDLTFRGAI